MPIRVALNHKTTYRYDRYLQLQPHVIRLRPAPHCRTPVTSYSLRVHPKQHFLNWQQDPYNNYLARLVFPELTDELTIEVDLVAELTVINPFDFFLEDYAERYPFEYPPELAKELTPYLAAEPAGPRLQILIEELHRGEMRIVDYLVELNQALQKRLKYDIRMEPGVQTPEETLTKGGGSCRDFAWLLVQLLRHFKLAARFVSGYSIQLKADVKPLDGPAGVEEDFADLHAWTEVYLPGAGWVGLDSTSGLLAGEGHLPLACAAEPVTAAPVTGSFGFTGEPPREEFSYQMRVTRIREAPRVTLPYSEAAWERLLVLGDRVDQELAAGDVRLTMGGEPTFVSVDDMDGDEWNLTALGEAKRKLAGQLMLRLEKAFASGAVRHYGQGKLYPGESLPRWALSVIWRHDGLPLWRDPRWMADEEKDYGYGPEEARRFMLALAQELGVSPDHVSPGYEDIAYFLWRESRLPVNVNPLESNLDDPEERARLARVFSGGLGNVIGYSLPLRLQQSHSGAVWQSEQVQIRREPMRLMPGDSPMGYRLPLDSLPWVSKEEFPWPAMPDSFEERLPLPEQRTVRAAASVTAMQRQGEHPYANVAPPAPARVIRTFACVEPRHGRLYVFMPPFSTADDYFELLQAVEDTAARLMMPVLLEGYAPPEDPRLVAFSVTPDPGVIEVNLHPSANWRELVDKTRTLYDLARQTRLGAEKFMLDGRHCGTGGGNHLILGGSTPSDSPFLRRPHLLRSMLAYWINHPSLSYLFSGLFIGPTSQAPRLDEARHDSLYELEIAFEQILSGDSSGRNAHDEAPYWLVDRVFRHLLTDATGNTHRAEFCIDKLYSPDGPGGRRGLVEFRNFEMPPDYRMSLAQQLVLRALTAWLWREPYRAPLVRWGTDLHDRFMLSHFVRRDFYEVLSDLEQAGFPFDREWFEAHFEFRFPRLGAVLHRGVELELRVALEPWHVLGETPGLGGQVRYVDSSLERVEVTVRGMTDSRHAVTCNGRRLPLTPTGVRGEFVAGVRYRAWQPPHCLHPTIEVHAPLVLDLVDTWSNRSIGGCTYHVAHPGGRSYDTFPVNAYEAEARRTARFFSIGHSPGQVEAPPLELNPEFPVTLDLRR